MKICVFSDSHGHTDPMLRAIAENRPDQIIHLGDGNNGRDLKKIESQFPQIPLKAVCGNCDLSSNLPERVIFDCGGAKLFCTHGHIYRVKPDLSSLLNAGHFAGADLVLYGHTHIAKHDLAGNMQVLNPGSCGSGASASFALVVIDDSGAISCRIVKL